MRQREGRNREPAERIPLPLTRLSLRVSWQPTTRLSWRDGHTGVPVAGVQKTTIHGSTIEPVEENEGLRPHIPWTKTPDCVHVYRGISPTNRVFFHTSAACPRMPHLSQKNLSKRLVNTNTCNRSLFFAPKLREPRPAKHRALRETIATGQF